MIVWPKKIDIANATYRFADAIYILILKVYEMKKSAKRFQYKKLAVNEA